MIENVKNVNVKNAINTLSKLALILVVVFLSVVLLDILLVNKVSPWHDELWNLYASLEFYGIRNGIWPGCSQSMCMTVFGYDIPILSGPYHGVVKALIFSPIVLLGDISLIRLLNVVIYLSPMVYILKQGRTFGVSGTYLIASAYYLMFPVLFLESIFDQGQFVVPNAFLAIAALMLVKDLHLHSPGRLVFVIILSALAVYEKVTNIPVSLAFSTVAFVLLLQNREFRYAWASFASFIFALPYAYYLSSNMSSFLGMTDATRLSYITNLKLVAESAYTYLFQKSHTMSMIVGVDVDSVMPVLCVILSVAVLILSITLCFRIGVSKKSAHMLTISTPFIALLLFPLFSGLNRPWHMYQIAPLLIIPFAYTALNMNLMNIVEKNKASMLLLMVILLGFINTISLSTGSVNKPRIHPYDTSIIETADLLKRQSFTKNVVCLDYSVCNNLIFILGSEYKHLASWSFSPLEDICQNIDNIRNSEYYLVTHIYQPVDMEENHILSKLRIDKGQYDFLYGRSKYFIENCPKSFSGEIGDMDLYDKLGYKIYLHTAEHQ